MTEANIAAMHNAFYSQVYNFSNYDIPGWNVPVVINLDKAVRLASNPNTLLNYLDKLLLASEMPATMRTRLKPHLEDLPDTGNLAVDRAKDAIFTIIASPAFMVQD